MRLLEKLQNYSKENVTPLHMPGHKRKGDRLPYNIDITEIDNFDNLQNPSGILKECLIKASKVYGSFRTFYSVNGGTCGVLSALATYCDIGDKIIVATNCHKSVYNFIEMFNLRAVYVLPTFNKWGIANSFSADDFKIAVTQNLDAKAVILTSPTYEGVISDIESISNFLHQKNIPLIVDEAHGSHLVLTGKSALNFGADIVLNSCHKTLSGLTQTALIHIGNNALNKEAVAKKLQDKLNKFQSSSPSYVLMASIDESVEFIKNYGQSEIKRFKENLKRFEEQSKALKNIKILCYNEPFICFDFDKSKVVISASPYLTGSRMMDELRSLGFELEMCYNNYCIAMMTIFDGDLTFESFINALIKIDKKIGEVCNFSNKGRDTEISFNRKRKFVLTIHDARREAGTLFGLDNAISKVSQEYIYAYPPGSPILVPGEIVTKAFVGFMLDLIKNGIRLHSTTENVAKGEIMCLTNNFKKV